MLFQKKKGSTIKKKEEKEKKRDLARFKADIKFSLLTHALEAHHQIYEPDCITAWNKVAEKIRTDIKANEIPMVDYLVLDGKFMQMTFEKYMAKFSNSSASIRPQNRLTLSCDIMLFKLTQLRHTQYNLLTKLTAEKYGRIQREKYSEATSIKEKLEAEAQQIKKLEFLEEELKSKDKSIDELTLKNKGLLKVVEGFKKGGKL